MVAQEKEGLSCEHEHLKRRTEAIMADYEHEKQVIFFFFYCDRVTISLELLLIIILCVGIVRPHSMLQYKNLEHGRLIYDQYTNHQHIFFIMHVFMEKDSYRECFVYFVPFGYPTSLVTLNCVHVILSLWCLKNNIHATFNTRGTIYT